MHCFTLLKRKPPGKSVLFYLQIFRWPVAPPSGFSRIRETGFTSRAPVFEKSELLKGDFKMLKTDGEP
jgi:hypothetical protein